MAIPPPWAIAAMAARRAAGLPDISMTTSKPSTMSSSANATRGCARVGSIDERGAHPGRQLAPIGVRLADDDVARAGVAGDGRRHQPDRAGAADQHVLAEDRERERGVDRVAERVEDRGDLLVDARPVVPDVGHRQRDVLGERAVAADAEPDRVGAQVAPAGQAVPAAAAHDVTLARDEVARMEVGHVATDLDDLADELVADDERRLDRPGGPRIPRLDVEVRAADARLVDPDQDVVDADRPASGRRAARGPARGRS